jgi:hypothetical protein
MRRSSHSTTLKLSQLHDRSIRPCNSKIIIIDNNNDNNITYIHVIIISHTYLFQVSFDAELRIYLL